MTNAPLMPLTDHSVLSTATRKHGFPCCGIASWNIKEKRKVRMGCPPTEEATHT